MRTSGAEPLLQPPFREPVQLGRRKQEALAGADRAAAAVVVLVGIGVVIPAVNVAVGPIILGATPRAFVGRVSATLNPLANGGAMLGVLLGGALYGAALREFRAHVLGVQFGPLDTIFMGVGLLCVFAGLYARANLRGQVSDENGDRA